MIKKMGFYLMSLYVIVGMASPANSDWFYDFKKPLPLSFITAGLCLDGTPSPTFSASTDGGFLTLADPIPAAEGGTYQAFGGKPFEKFTDVRITGTLNKARESVYDIGHLGLLARANIVTLSTYNAAYNAWGGYLPEGYLVISKFVNGSEVEIARSYDPEQGSQRTLFYNSRRFFLQFDVVGNLLSARLFNREGGRQLLVVHYTDTGTSGPPLASGASGLGIMAKNTRQSINGTFDDVASVAVSDTIINGRVTSIDDINTDGIPLRALVMVTNLKMTVVRRAVADVAGGYSFTDLEEGIYLVFAYRKGYELGVHKAWVRNGKASTVIFELAPRGLIWTSGELADYILSGDTASYDTDPITAPAQSQLEFKYGGANSPDVVMEVSLNGVFLGTVVGDSGYSYPGPEYETWNVTGILQNGVNHIDIVALPGGGEAVIGAFSIFDRITGQ